MAVAVKTKAWFLLAVILGAEAARTRINVTMVLGAEAARTRLNVTIDEQSRLSAVERVERSGSLPVGIQAVTVYAAGNCQFMPLFDVAHFMAETAPVAARAGMMAKPVVTAGVAAQGAVHMGTKAGLLSRLAGGMFGISNPAGLALNVGLTAYQLWQLQRTMKNPAALCKFAAMIPPFSTSICAGLGNVTKNIALPQPPAGVTNQLLRPEVVLAATAVVLVSVGGFAIWHMRVRKATYDKAFCPSNKWTLDPQVTFPVGETGMSRCNGLHRVNVPVQCGTDLACRHASCQQACCDEDDCSMYQFDDKEPLKCWLGRTETSFSSDKCERWRGLSKTSEMDEEFTSIFIPHPRLLNQVRGLSAKTIKVSIKVKDPDADRMRQCKNLCNEDDSCTFFQFQVGDDKCWTGSAPLDTYTTSEWHGGSLAEPSSSPRGCGKGEKQCPTSSDCVKSCAECEGFSIDGNDEKCSRSADEAVCDPDSWSETYNDRSLNSVQCVGLQPQDVIMDEDTQLNGHAVCREACCGDPDCVLYQVRQKYVKPDGLSHGTKVHCWLGKVDSSFNPLFTCKQEVQEGFAIRQWAGGYLEKRGCGSDQFSCILTNECVANCAAQCPGASLADASGRRCTQDDVQSAEVDQLTSHPLTDLEDSIHVPSHLINAAVVKSESSGGGKVFWLHQDETTDTEEKAAVDELLMIAQNKRRFITQSSQSICDNLAIGAYQCIAKGGGCSCDYAKAQQCTSFFYDEGHLRPIVMTQGLVLLSYDTCQCSAQKTKDWYSCQFDFMDSIPAFKLARSDEQIVSI